MIDDILNDGFKILAIFILFISITAGASAYFSQSNDIITFSFNMTSSQAVEVRDAFTTLYGYQDTICERSGNDPRNITTSCYPNPENKNQFTDRKIKEHIKDVVIAYRTRQAQLNNSINNTVTVN